MNPSSLGHYQILEKIGAGGMGEVYRARDTRLDRQVALKVLSREAAVSPDRIERFKREAKTVAALNHPHIVTIYSVEDVSGVHFLTMELVTGRPLSALIVEGGMPCDQFLDIARPLVDAVRSAHQQGVIHRDLKPANIMVDGEQRLKVLDFGLAKLWSGAEDDDHTLPAGAPLTQPGGVVGTVPYMSPEQVTGTDIDHRSDIFSLGTIFHELLTGQRPFQGDYPAAVMNSIVEDPAPPLSAPPAVATLVRKCLAKLPEQRFATAEELLGALQSLQPDTTAATAGPEPGSPAERAVAEGRWLDARQVLQELEAQRELTPAEFELLGMTEFWTGTVGDRIAAAEKAYSGYVKSGDPTAAARVALDLSHDYEQKCSPTLVTAWRRRAETLLADRPESVEHGRLLRLRTVKALAAFDFEQAADCNRQCRDIAERHNDIDLRVEAIHDRGQILVAQGRVSEGTALIDEAMTEAVSGQVSHITLGNLYCRTLTVCRALADFKRAQEWGEVALRWCSPFQGSGYSGVCRIHSAETLRHHGRWIEAEAALRRAAADFEASGGENHAGEAYYELGELLLRQGNLEESEAAFLRAHALGQDPVPGLALLRLVQGKPGPAGQIIKRALDQTPDDRLLRVRLLVAAASIALSCDDVPAAEAALDEVNRIAEDFDCPAFGAHADLVRGGLELQRGSPQALPLLRQAWSSFKTLGFPYDAARARSVLAQAYVQDGNTEDARLELESAATTFEALGARIDLDTAKRHLESLTS